MNFYIHKIVYLLYSVAPGDKWVAVFRVSQDYYLVDIGTVMKYGDIRNKYTTLCMTVH